SWVVVVKDPCSSSAHDHSTSVASAEHDASRRYTAAMGASSGNATEGRARPSRQTERDIPLPALPVQEATSDLQCADRCRAIFRVGADTAPRDCCGSAPAAVRRMRGWQGQYATRAAA